MTESDTKVTVFPEICEICLELFVEIIFKFWCSNLFISRDSMREALLVANGSSCPAQDMRMACQPHPHVLRRTRPQPHPLLMSAIKQLALGSSNAG